MLLLEVRAKNEQNMNINDELKATEKPTGAAVSPEIREFVQHDHKPHYVFCSTDCLRMSELKCTENGYLKLTASL